MARDFYAELGVKRNATQDEIKRAYRRLAAELHPDRKPGDTRAEARFKEVNRAYQVLSDPKKRSLYDEFGEEALREGFNPEVARAYYRRARGGAGPSAGAGGFNLEDLLGGIGRGGIGDLMGDLFGGARGPRRGRAKGPDLHAEVTVDFVSAIRGTHVQVPLQGTPEGVSVRIPPGANDGDKVRVAGQGLPGPMGGAPGDIVISIRVSPHPFFQRDGLDLHLDLPITPGEAYRGAKVRVPTPKGDVTLTVPRHAQSGQVVRLRGRGVQRKSKVGDLYVRFLVNLPQAESGDVDRAIETLDRSMTGDVREGLRF